MKIVCDNCATKYSIADEKVRGKVFKIRCKKCSHIIVVKGVEGEGGAVDAGANDAPAEPEPTGDGWHVVINGEQVGPLSPTEVRGKFAGGEIDGETFAWKEGFGDWQRLASIDDFRDLAAAPADSTKRSSTEDLFGGGDTTAGPGDLFGSPGGDLFAGSAAAPAPAPAASSAGAGLFAQPVAEPEPRRPTGGFAAQRAPEPVAAAPAPAAAAGGKMTGQRNENSVLFSLNNLQALASGGPAGKPAAAAATPGVDNRPGFANSQTEGSGLIDIRAMAAATLSSSPSSSSPMGSNNDLPAFSAAPVFSPIAAPILMPSASSGPPKWVWPVVGLAGLTFVGLIVVAVLMLTKKPDVVAMGPQVPVAVAPGTPPAVAPTAAPLAVAPTAAAPTGTSPTAAAPTVAAPAAATPDKHGGKNAAAKGAKATAPASGTKVAKAETPAPAAPEPAAAPAAKKPGKKGGGDELDDLLNGASPDKPKKQAVAAHEDASNEDLPEQLDKGAIVSGMGKVKAKVSGCYDQFKVPGLANVSVTIVKSGKVSNATVSGAFAGTPTGECVQKAVKAATFSQFKGAAQTIAYPFMLR